MTGTLACLFWLWWVGGHTSYGSFGLVSCWVRERPGQCPARFDSFDLRAGAHERGGLRFELCISPMPGLYVQEGGLFLGLCTGWRLHFGAICIEGVFIVSSLLHFFGEQVGVRYHQQQQQQLITLLRVIPTMTFIHFLPGKS